MGLLDALKKKKPEAAPVPGALPGAPPGVPLPPGAPPGVPPPPMPGALPGAPPIPGAPPPPPGNTPVDLVKQLEAQNKTDQEIVAELTKKGFDQTQVYDAIVQSRQAGGPEPVAPVAGAAPVEQPNVQEAVERVVEEKWKDVQKELAKTNDWRDKVEARNTKIETNVQDLKADLENLHKAIVSKIGEYDRNLLDVGVEIKAMEQVFKKVLPELTTNVQELSRMTRKSKDVKEKPKRK